MKADGELHALLHQPDGGALAFRGGRVVRAETPRAVPAALCRLERALRKGRTLALALSYELGHLLATPPLPWPDRPHYPVPRPPLIWALEVDAPAALDAGAAEAWLRARESRSATRFVPTSTQSSPPQPLVDERAFQAAFRRVRQYIDAGDVYQVNFTFPLAFATGTHPARLQRAMLRRQPAPHAAFLELSSSLWAMSASPELFLEFSPDGGVRSRPMKGTAARAVDPARDAAAAEALRTDVKTQAENLMIADLMRNDLGRVAEVGSVCVPALLVVESYPTVHQMVSEVRARIHNSPSLPELLRAVLPAGSITGAPKRRAMEIIDVLEAQARGLYTGCIGWLRRTEEGHYEGVLSVAIRTVVMDARGRGRMGVGAGLVADSVAEDEYAECLLKARFLRQALADCTASA